MDKVQIYYTILYVLAVIINLYQHGEPKTGRHDFRVDFVAMVAALPMTGRIFGWW